MKTPSTWTAIILLSSLLAWFVVFADLGGPLQFGVMIWFLAVCSGMMVTRFLRLREPLIEWTLAVALSFTIGVLAGGAAVMLGAWNSSGVFSVLLALTVIGALLSEVENVDALWKAWR